MSRRTSLSTTLTLVAITVLAFNLRPAAVSVGPLLDRVTAALGMSAVEAGVLTSLPVLAFAVFGALAPRAARLVGVHRLTLLALLAVVAGLWVRAQVSAPSLFLLLSLVALAGMASANVLLPSLVKLHFPHLVGLVTAIYSTSLAVGLASASVLTVPVAERYGGWRPGLQVWALTAAVAALPWLGLLAHDSAPERTRSSEVTLGQVARTRLGRNMALFFGLQSLQAYSVFGWFASLYRSAGFSEHTAGLLLGVITGISIPLSFVIPNLAARIHRVWLLLTVLMACYPLGYAGLMLAPHAGAWVWALVVGTGASTFPLILALIGLRARTPAGTAALSGFTQSVGYLIAALGPFAVGMLHDLSGGWTLPLLFLLVLSVPQLLVGLSVSRRQYVEDELSTSPTPRPAGRASGPGRG